MVPTLNHPLSVIGLQDGACVWVNVTGTCSATVGAFWGQLLGFSCNNFTDFLPLLFVSIHNEFHEIIFSAIL